MINADVFRHTSEKDNQNDEGRFGDATCRQFLLKCDKKIVFGAADKPFFESQFLRNNEHEGKVSLTLPYIQIQDVELVADTRDTSNLSNFP